MRFIVPRNFIKSIVITAAIMLGSTTAYAGQLPSPAPSAGAELTNNRTWNFTVGKNRDLFSNMKGLMPGDTIENKVAITNNSSQAVTFYFRVQPGDIIEIEAGSEDAAAIEGKTYQSDLLDTIAMDIWREDTLVYRGNASGRQEAGESSSVISLGQVESHGTLSLSIEIKLPGEGMDNKYAASFSKIDWQFIAEGTDGGSMDNGGGNSGTNGGPGGGNSGDNGGPGVDSGFQETPDGNGVLDIQQPDGVNQPVTTDNIPDNTPGATIPTYRGGGILAENVPAEDLFPQGGVVDNPDDMQIIVEDEPVPLAAFSDMMEPGILFHYFDLFLVLSALGLILFYLLPFKRRREDSEERKY